MGAKRVDALQHRSLSIGIDSRCRLRERLSRNEKEEEGETTHGHSMQQGTDQPLRSETPGKTLGLESCP